MTQILYFSEMAYFLLDRLLFYSYNLIIKKQFQLKKAFFYRPIDFYSREKYGELKAPPGIGEDPGKIFNWERRSD